MSTKPEGPSIWIFVSGFLVLGVIGLAFLLMVGSPATDTEPASNPYWEDGPVVSDSRAQSSGATTSGDQKGKTKVVEDPGKDATGAESKGDSTTTTEPASPPATFPGGEPAPPDVTKVLRQDGSTSLSFQIAQGALGDNPHALVPPIRTKVPANSSSITIWISCAQSSRESLAQVSVSETDRQVTVAAIVLVPANSVGCDSSAAPRELTVPLQSPVGNRTVTVVPANTKLPDITPG